MQTELEQLELLVERRWNNERAYFDRQEYPEDPIPANTLERYTRCRAPFTPAEYHYSIMGDVRGKRIFELGSGNGRRAVILALKGAKVVGVDISAKAVEAAIKLARLHGVSDRVEFHAAPLETYLVQARGKFDIICGFAILHHLIPVLDSVLCNLKRLAHERTMFLFSEPVSLARWLRRFRLVLPIPVHGTLYERPLEQSELAVLHSHLPKLEVHVSQFLIRVWARFVGGRPEDYSPVQRLMYHALCRMDKAFFAVPAFRRLGGEATIFHRSE
jgi:2-polyprenyl-3-methyl-5-hydroxy-6-metoxy-1,4-benzoquinol methylase